MSFMNNVNNYARFYRRILAFVGCLPNSTGQFNLGHIAVVLFCTLYTTAVTGYSVLVAGDIDQMSFSVVPFLAALLMVVKHVMFVLKRDDNSDLIRTIYDEFWGANVASTAREQAVIEQYARGAYLCNLVQFSTILAGASFWLVMPFIEMFFLAGRNDRILPFRSWTPSNIDAYTDPWYEIIYLSQCLAVWVSALVLIGADCLYVQYVINTCAQFKLLQLRTTGFDKDDNDKEITLEEQEKKVHRCIEMHQRLLRYCDKLEDTLTLTLLMQFFENVGFLCICGFTITMFPGDAFITGHSILCIVTALCQSFLFCYSADLLTSEGMEVAYATYASNWLDAPQGIKKMLLFMILRAQKPVYLTLGNLAPVSIVTFVTITKSASSYFTVLTSMKEDD